jgi:hypothetical protein
MKRRTTKRKRTTGAGTFMRKVQRAAKVRTVRNRIKKKKAELKKLSTAYKKAVKETSKRLSKKR